MSVLSPPPPRSNNQKGLQTSPAVPWAERPPCCSCPVPTLVLFSQDRVTHSFGSTPAGTRYLSVRETSGGCGAGGRGAPREESSWPALTATTSPSFCACRGPFVPSGACEAWVPGGGRSSALRLLSPDELLVSRQGLSGTPAHLPSPSARAVTPELCPDAGLLTAASSGAGLPQPSPLAQPGSWRGSHSAL